MTNPQLRKIISEMIESYLQESVFNNNPDHKQIDGRFRVYVPKENEKKNIVKKDIDHVKNIAYQKTGKKHSFDTHGHDGERRYIDLTPL